MKDLTPIKRHQALVEFSRDHHFGLLLVWKIKQGLANAVDPGRISNYIIYFFENDLQEHFREEELHLFPLLPADDELRLRAEKDHAHLYEMIDCIRSDKTNRRLLSDFAETLKLHIRFEERELFASIQSALPAEFPELISHRDECCKTDPDANWPDFFWVKHKADPSSL